MRSYDSSWRSTNSGKCSMDSSLVAFKCCYSNSEECAVALPVGSRVLQNSKVENKKQEQKFNDSLTSFLNPSKIPADFVLENEAELKCRQLLLTVGMTLQRGTSREELGQISST